MKFIFLLFILLFSSSCSNKRVDNVANIYATSYVVINSSDNKILEGSNYNISRSVASISKIMTAIIAIENSDVYEEITITKNGCNIEGSSVYLKENQKITILDLLYGLLLRSGNDAATSLAIATFKDINKFVDKMNEKANMLKLDNTYFNNPTGLDIDDSGNVSSALDMAVLYSYCLKNPLFATIVNTKQYKNYINKNRLLKEYEYCNGGKTGYTLKAKRTLITSAYKDDMQLIIVTLNCGNDFNLHKQLYEYYFNNYVAICYLKKGYMEIENKEIYIPNDYTFIIKKTNNNYSLYYKIDLNKKEIEAYLLDESKKVLDNKTINFL